MEDWTPTNSLEAGKRKMEALNIPKFNMDLTPREDLDFSNLMNVENRQLEVFLTMYGGYKAYMETELADQEAIVGALEASFVEEYSMANFKVGKEYTELSMRKPTKEELRGEILTKFPDILASKQRIIDEKVKVQKLSGLLNTYTTAYNTVSRVVALRTFRPTL